MESTLGENRRGDAYIVNLSPGLYVLILFDGFWTAIEMTRPFHPNTRKVLYDSSK